MSPSTELYEAARLPPSIHAGTSYPHPSNTQDSLSALYNGHSSASLADHAPSWNPVLEEATTHLEDVLHPKNISRAAAGALLRLMTLKKLGSSWGPDIVYKAFDDLDLALFDGRLRGRCGVQWKTEEEFQVLYPGSHRLWATTDFCQRVIKDPRVRGERVWQTRIYLNSSVHFLDPLAPYTDEEGEERQRSRWEEMWGTLLHEMCHAYLRLVTHTSLRDWMWSEGKDRGHGSHFRRCLRAVNRRSAEYLGFVGIWEEGKKIGCCAEEEESCADEVDNDDQYYEEEYYEEEYGTEEYYEEEYDEEEWNEEEWTEEEKTEGDTNIEDESVFDSNPADNESTNGEISDPGTPEVESLEAEVKPQQEEIKAEQEEAAIEMTKAVPKPEAPPAPVTWANWNGKLLENVELRHVSREVPIGKQGGEVEKKVEVEVKKVEAEVKNVEVKEKKAEVVTWANWKGRLLEN